LTPATKAAVARRSKKAAFASVQDPDDWTLEASGPEAISLFHRESNNRLNLDLHLLRDSCQCDGCVDPDSGQKTFGTCDIPATVHVQSHRKTDGGGLEVVWRDDFFSPGRQNHTSYYSPDRIRKWFVGLIPGRIAHRKKTLWDKSIFETCQRTVDYNDWMAGGSNFHAALAQLNQYGLLFLDNVPKSEDSVITIANQIGNLQETFYGRTWDVRSKPKAENVA
jgi:gamma-butyrobetaine dioxygenase